MGFIEVYVNGVLLTDTTDFTATNGSSVTFTVALLVNDEVTVVSLKTFTVADHYTKSAADTLLAAKSPLASPVFTGNVGIGVTPESAWASAYTVLQTGGTGAQWSNDNQVAGAIFDQGQNIYRDASAEKYIVTDEASKYRQYSGKHIFQVAPSGTADSAISWTTAMTIGNAGAVTMPNQPAFFAYPTATQSNIAVGISTIVLNAERFDQSGDFNTSTSTFTAPVTGKYQFNLNVRIGAIDTAASYYRTYITTSNEAYYPTIIDPNFTADLDYFHLCFSVLADMDAGDTAYARVQQAGGTAQSDIINNASQANFSGYLVA